MGLGFCEVRRTSRGVNEQRGTAMSAMVCRKTFRARWGSKGIQWVQIDKRGAILETPREVLTLFVPGARRQPPRGMGYCFHLLCALPRRSHPHRGSVEVHLDVKNNRMGQVQGAPFTGAGDFMRPSFLEPQLLGLVFLSRICVCKSSVSAC